MTHKYDDINKVLKENNTSPCDEEESRVLKMTLKEVYQVQPDEVKNHLNDFHSVKSDDSEFFWEDDRDMEMQYIQRLNEIMDNEEPK